MYGHAYKLNRNKMKNSPTLPSPGKKKYKQNEISNSFHLPCTDKLFQRSRVGIPAGDALWKRCSLLNHQ